MNEDPGIPLHATTPDSGYPEYQPPMGLWARLMNVFAAPGEVFEEVRQGPPSAANWLVPALLAMLLGWGGATIIFSLEPVKQQLAEISDQAVQKQIEKMHASPEQAEQIRTAAEKFAGVGQKVGAYGVTAMVAFASPFLWGLIVWLVGSKKFNGGFPFMKAVEVVGLSNMVEVLHGIIKTLLIVGMGSLWASPSAALLVLRDFNPQNPLHSALAALNVMVFWLLAVRAEGLARLSGVSFARAAAWVFGIWLVYTGLFMAFGFAMQKIFS